MTQPTLPTLIVGDVHGDLERLFAALKPYPPDEWRTVFLGDLVDGGPFGVGALRYARDRPNSQVILGNHEVAMLWALDDRATLSNWFSIGGQPHDLEELRRDEPLQLWVRRLPALVVLDDGSLAQHNDTDNLGRFVAGSSTNVVESVNAKVRDALERHEYAKLWDAMAPGGTFGRQPPRLESWLARTGARRVVHGHRSHTSTHPLAYNGGRAINYDGRLSRYYGNARFRRISPLGASVAPLPALHSKTSEPKQDGRHDDKREDLAV